jgi:tetratricopeptide (TPR) repeat protein
VWLAQQRFAEAARFLGAQLEKLGHPPELYVALGIVYREAKQAHEAMRAFEQALARRSDYAQAQFYLAAQLDQLGRRQEARLGLRRAIELDPNHPDAMNYLGYMDAEDGVNLEEAKALVERAIELDPDNGAYLDSLGWVYYKLGNIERAILYLEQAAERLDTDAVIFDHLGEAYFKRRELEKARRNWERALELDPDQTTIREKLQWTFNGPGAPVP